MFESNFPVDKLSLSYDVYWNAMKKLLPRTLPKSSTLCSTARQSEFIACKSAGAETGHEFRRLGLSHIVRFVADRFCPVG